jgi:AcrR family transcriptional regulator
LVEAILAAAAQLFAELGYAHTTTNKIARRAGVSVGSLYQYFPNKDSVLHELLVRHHADVQHVLQGALVRLADPAHPLEDELRRLLQQLVTLHRADPALTQALSSSVLRESVVGQGLHKKDQHHAQQVVAVLASRPDVRTGDHVAMALILGEVTGHLSRWLVHDAPAGADSDNLVEEAVQLLARYLGA